MNKSNASEVKRGQTISFRVPSDIPDHLLRQLQKLKETERRNFSSKIAEFVVQGVGTSYGKEKETITVPLPGRLTKVQRDWLKHEHSEALLGSIVYQLLQNPVRSASLLASMNSNRTDIDEALYLQEESPEKRTNKSAFEPHEDQAAATRESLMESDDLDSFDWESIHKENKQQEEPKQEALGSEAGLDDLLGDFLARMND
ncbi:hypothetical protein [Bacillus massilinigeriensis]|uniref:hypothetical protein n=1 Tax=Bacillus mediterraneensis TaxID=1805474 RepID=UPI0008F88D79|nr:hypothetical protein [Bacillus mediterraneensis]